MQNKPNLLNAQMNVTSFYTVDYENIANWKLGENKPNTNPIQTQSNPILSAVLSGVALAKTEALAKADSNPAPSNFAHFPIPYKQHTQPIFTHTLLAR
jgi:hypothetical protein